MFKEELEAMKLTNGDISFAYIAKWSVALFKGILAGSVDPHSHAVSKYSKGEVAVYVEADSTRHVFNLQDQFTVLNEIDDSKSPVLLAGMSAHDKNKVMLHFWNEESGAFMRAPVQDVVKRLCNDESDFCAASREYEFPRFKQVHLVDYFTNKPTTLVTTSEFFKTSIRSRIRSLRSERKPQEEEEIRKAEHQSAVDDLQKTKRKAQQEAKKALEAQALRIRQAEEAKTEKLRLKIIDDAKSKKEKIERSAQKLIHDQIGKSTSIFSTPSMIQQPKDNSEDVAPQSCDQSVGSASKRQRDKSGSSPIESWDLPPRHGGSAQESYDDANDASESWDLPPRHGGSASKRQRRRHDDLPSHESHDLPPCYGGTTAPRLRVHDDEYGSLVSSHEPHDLPPRYGGTAPRRRVHDDEYGSSVSSHESHDLPPPRYGGTAPRRRVHDGEYGSSVSSHESHDLSPRYGGTAPRRRRVHDDEYGSSVSSHGSHDLPPPRYGGTAPRRRVHDDEYGASVFSHEPHDLPPRYGGSAPRRRVHDDEYGQHAFRGGGSQAFRRLDADDVNMLACRAYDKASNMRMVDDLQRSRYEAELFRNLYKHK